MATFTGSKGFEGYAKLNKKLEKLGGNADKVCRDTVRASTEKALAGARTRVPKRSGTLSGTIKTEYEQGGMRGSVNSSHPIAHLVELGTGERGAASPSPPKWPGTVNYNRNRTEGKGRTKDRAKFKGKGNWKGMPAKPYLYPSSQEQRESYPKAMAEAMSKEIEKLSGK